MNINLTKPNIDDEELNAAAEVLKSGWLIRGKNVQAFEEEFARFMGAKYAVATNGCTMALYLVLKRMNLKPDDEVIVPSLTWSATAAVVIHAGAKPVFADVSPTDWCLDPEDVKRKLTSKTRMVIPVHYAGRFVRGFENFPVPVMYDSAHRVEANDFKGTVSCYSFYAVKNMTTVRGGMILTDNEDDYKWYMMAVHGGLSKDTLSRYQGQQKEQDASSFYYEVEWPGWNFDMTDVEAAIGRKQLLKLPAANARRNEIVKIYNQAFGLNNQGNHLYPILVEDRDKFLIKMKEVGIHCGVHYLPLHLMRGYAQFKGRSLPTTEFIGAHCVSLPLHALLSETEINFVIEQTQAAGRIIKEELPKALVQKPKLSIGIPAFNESANIKPLLTLLLRQTRNNYSLEEILVVSDGSTDDTVAQAQSTGSDLVHVISDDRRLGQQLRQNQMLNLYKGDLLLIIEADTLPCDDMVIDSLVKTVVDYPGSDLGMVVGESIPQQPVTFFEKILFFGARFKLNLFDDWNSGNNLFNSGGQAMKILTRKFVDNLAWPAEVPEDSYCYFRMKELGLVMVKQSMSRSYFRSVTHVHDRYRQTSKYKSGKHSLEKYFGKRVLEQEYNPPVTLAAKHVGKSFMNHPVMTFLMLCEMVVNRIITIRSRRFNALYEPYYSSKDLNFDHVSTTNFTPPTVTLAVSAYNEEQNIIKFLDSVTTQEQTNYILEKILIISDGSNDRTVEIIKNYNHPKIELIEGGRREGKSTRLNDIYSHLNSDILIQSDADVEFSHAHVISNLVSAMMSNSKVGMCGGHPLPIPGTTFTEKAVNCTVMAYDTFRGTLRGGNNVFSADGRILAYRKEFVKQIDIPRDMIANDMFTYFCCKDLGFEYRYVAQAIVYFRSPQTLRDQIRQNTRFVAAPARMKKYFSEELVISERNIPPAAFLIATLQQFARHPILCSYIFAVNQYCRLRAKIVEKQLSAVWDVAFSTKRLK